MIRILSSANLMIPNPFYQCIHYQSFIKKKVTDKLHRSWRIRNNNQQRSEPKRGCDFNMRKKYDLLIGIVAIVYLIGMLYVVKPIPANFPDSVQSGAIIARQQDPNHVYHRGDRGGYVWELQNRLRFLGFYTGPVNGIFTERTEKAVRLFQYEFRMVVDGLVGPKTKEKLWLATRNWRPNQGGDDQKPVRTSHGFSQRDIELIARTVYGEARGEPYIGQVAVAAVVLNRVESEKFPNTPSAVIFQPMAFTAVADGQIWLTPNETAKKATQDALNGWDPSGGALYYFNPATATSKWIWSRPQIKQIGKHIFCK